MRAYRRPTALAHAHEYTRLASIVQVAHHDPCAPAKAQDNRQACGVSQIGECAPWVWRKGALVLQVCLYYKYVYARLKGYPAANQTFVPRPPRSCTTAHCEEEVDLHPCEGACTSCASARCGRVPPGTYLMAWTVLWYALPHNMFHLSRAPSGVSMSMTTTQPSDNLTNPYGYSEMDWASQLYPAYAAAWAEVGA